MAQYTGGVLKGKMFSTPKSNVPPGSLLGENLHTPNSNTPNNQMNKSKISIFSDMFSSFLPSRTCDLSGIERTQDNKEPNQGGRERCGQSILHTTVAILLSVTVLLLLAQIYFIFLPCLKALFWALLLGSVIFGFKRSLRIKLQIWLDALDKADCSLLSGLVRLPFDSIGNFYQDLVEFISTNKVLFLVFHFRVQIWQLSVVISSMLFTLLQYNSGIISFVVIIAITAQVLLVLFRQFANFLPSILSLLVFYALQYLGILGIASQLFLVLIFSFGVVRSLVDFYYNPESTSKNIREELKLVLPLFNQDVKRFISNALHVITRSLFSQSGEDCRDSSSETSQVYFRKLFILTGFMIAEQLGLSNIVFIVYCGHLVVTNLLKTLWEKSKQCFSFTFEIFSTTISTSGQFITEKIRNDLFFQTWSYFFLKGDKMIQKSIQSSLDLIASAGIIISISFAGIFFTTFLSVMVYRECYSMANLAQSEITKIDFIRDRINSTVNEYTNPDYLNGLIQKHLTGGLNLKSDDQQQLNTLILDFGRSLLTFFNTSSHTTLLENSTTVLDPESHSSSAQFSYTENFQVLRSIFSQKYLRREFSTNFNYESVYTFLNSKASSFMPLVKAFSSIVYTLIFLILDSSSIVLGFILNFIIFGLALFYLLLTSRAKFRPMEIMDGILGYSDVKESSTPSQYVEEVVNSIFAATLKLSLFYGIYTWLLHSLFELQISFIPAVIAAVLGAVPILHAYWASFPTVLYIYLFDPVLPLTKSVAFAFFAIAPSFVVDSSIYSDIKRSGHPYLTGLAITCGIVHYGFEGALFGPLWLCFLFIILNACTSLTGNTQEVLSDNLRNQEESSPVYEKQTEANVSSDDH